MPMFKSRFKGSNIWGTFGAHLGLMSRFCTFQRQKRPWESGFKFVLWRQALLRGGREWAFCINDYTDYSDSIVMTEAFMPPFSFLHPLLSLSSLPLLKHYSGEIFFSYTP